MTYKEAVEIVYDLAKQNCLDIDDCNGDENLISQAKSQDDALSGVADMLENIDWQFIGSPAEWDDALSGVIAEWDNFGMVWKDDEPAPQLQERGELAE